MKKKIRNPELTEAIAKSDLTGGLCRRLEIVNPSDKCYIVSKNDEATCAAILIMSNGMYALKDKDETLMPILAFGGDYNKFWEDTFNRTLEEYLETKPFIEMAEALEGFEYACERTSMNNIGASCASWAKSFRKQAA